jgi:glycosyltransferase involved in cell wall biosynthesis/putative flippase GtrA
MCSAKGESGRWFDTLRVGAMAARFALVGALCAAINLAIMFLGTTLIGINYVAAAFATCLITIPLSYFFHRRITYRLPNAQKGEGTEFLRFVLNQLLQFAAGLCVLVVLVEKIGLTPIWGSVVMTGLMFVYGFLMNSTWVFQALTLRSNKQVKLEQPSRACRLLQVSAFFPKHGGGIEVVAGHIARGVARAGMCVHWMAGGAADEVPLHFNPELTVEHARSVDLLEKRVGVPFPVWTPASILRLWRAVRRCDVLQVHDFLYMPTLLAMCFAGLLRKPVVLTQHIGLISFRAKAATAILRGVNRTIGWLAMRLATQVIFVGRPVLEYFESFARFRRPPLLIANGVDHSTYCPPPSRADASALVRCLFVGRFVEKKGLSLLRRCIDLPGLSWSFIGWGPLSPHHWGELPCNVVAHGALGAEQVVPHFQAADLLVLPSTGEGFPLVVQEALACGTPVLVSTEVAEAFPSTDPNCVFNVELRSGDPVSALRQRLAELARDQALLIRARSSAAALARQWSWETCVRQYREVYDAAGPQGVSS